jgi:hypothetical protein
MRPSVNVLADLVNFLIKVGVVSIDLVDHGFLVIKGLDCLNALINHLVTLLDFAKQEDHLLTLNTSEVALSNESIDILFNTTLDW